VLQKADIFTCYEHGERPVAGHVVSPSFDFIVRTGPRLGQKFTGSEIRTRYSSSKP
jgi:hypothetical protein